MRDFVGAQKVWDNGERGQLARSDSAGKLPALPVLLISWATDHHMQSSTTVVAG